MSSKTGSRNRRAPGGRKKSRRGEPAESIPPGRKKRTKSARDGGAPAADVSPPRARKTASPAGAQSGAEGFGTGPFPVVGIGASAGGIEAFIEVFRHLPADTGMAFVVVTHLAPTHDSI